MFRVKAENIFGQSMPCQPVEAVTKAAEDDIDHSLKGSRSRHAVEEMFKHIFWETAIILLF